MILSILSAYRIYNVMHSNQRCMFCHYFFNPVVVLSTHFKMLDITLPSFIFSPVYLIHSFAYFAILSKKPKNVNDTFYILCAQCAFLNLTSLGTSYIWKKNIHTNRNNFWPILQKGALSNNLIDLRSTFTDDIETIFFLLILSLINLKTSVPVKNRWTQ